MREARGPNLKNSRKYKLFTTTITVIYTEKPSADFSAKTITKTAEGFFLDGVSVELVALG